MKLFKTIFLSLFTLFITFHGYAQRAKDGNYTVSTSGDVVNTYTSLTANANAGVTTLTVANNAMSGAHFSGNLAPGLVPGATKPSESSYQSVTFNIGPRELRDRRGARRLRRSLLDGGPLRLPAKNIYIYIY